MTPSQTNTQEVKQADKLRPQFSVGNSGIVRFFAFLSLLAISYSVSLLIVQNNDGDGMVPIFSVFVTAVISTFVFLLDFTRKKGRFLQTALLPTLIIVIIITILISILPS